MMKIAFSKYRIWNFPGGACPRTPLDTTTFGGGLSLGEFFLSNSLSGVASIYTRYARVYSLNLRKRYSYCLKAFLSLNWQIWYILSYCSDALCNNFHHPIRIEWKETLWIFNKRVTYPLPQCQAYQSLVILYLWRRGYNGVGLQKPIALNWDKEYMNM